MFSKKAAPGTVTPTKSQVESISGYVYDVTKVNYSRDKSRKYFNFTLQKNTGEEEKAVCFSPEKHKLLDDLSKADSNEKWGCEVKNFKRTADFNNILVTDFSSVKRSKLDFIKKDDRTQVPLSTVINESLIYDIVNVKGKLFNLSEKETVYKNGEALQLRKGVLKDDSGHINISLFANHADFVKEGNGYVLTHMRVAKFNHERFLKSTECTTINLDDVKVEVSEEEKLQHSTFKTVGIQIVSIDLKTFDAKVYCTNCKSEVIPEDDLVICSQCETLSTKDDCKRNTTIKFTGAEKSGKKMNFKAPQSIVEKYFEVDMVHKMKLAKAMIRSKVLIQYQEADVNIVCSIANDDEGSATFDE